MQFKVTKMPGTPAADSLLRHVRRAGKFMVYCIMFIALVFVVSFLLGREFIPFFFSVNGSLLSFVFTTILSYWKYSDCIFFIAGHDFGDLIEFDPEERAVQPNKKRLGASTISAGTIRNSYPCGAVTGLVFPIKISPTNV